MLIDRTHRPWAVWTGAAFVVATIVYLVDAGRAPMGPRGGSAIGLTFGIAGFSAMVFAALLSVRKKFRIWRIGRAQTWMRGHLWLGLLAPPLVLYHAGLTFGGPLTRVLLWLLFAVVASGVVGAALQHVLPRLMLERVPMETIYEEIPRIRQQLVEEADAIIGAVGDEASLRDFYAVEVRPFLLSPASASALGETRRAHDRFDQLRVLVAQAQRPAVDDLEDIVQEQQQLVRQLRLHHLLHGWLLVHVPLSFALLALSIVHIVMALRY